MLADCERERKKSALCATLRMRSTYVYVMACGTCGCRKINTAQQNRSEAKTQAVLARSMWPVSPAPLLSLPPDLPLLLL